MAKGGSPAGSGHAEVSAKIVDARRVAPVSAAESSDPTDDVDEAEAARQREAQDGLTRHDIEVEDSLDDGTGETDDTGGLDEQLTSPLDALVDRLGREDPFAAGASGEEDDGGATYGKGMIAAGDVVQTFPTAPVATTTDDGQEVKDVSTGDFAGTRQAFSDLPVVGKDDTTVADEFENADGSHTTVYGSGDIVTTYDDGTVEHQYPDGTTEIDKANGDLVTENVDGSTETIHPDGSVETTPPTDPPAESSGTDSSDPDSSDTDSAGTDSAGTGSEGSGSGSDGQGSDGQGSGGGDGAAGASDDIPADSDAGAPLPAWLQTQLAEDFAAARAQTHPVDPGDPRVNENPDADPTFGGSEAAGFAVDPHADLFGQLSNPAGGDPAFGAGSAPTSDSVPNPSSDPRFTDPSPEADTDPQFTGPEERDTSRDVAGTTTPPTAAEASDDSSADAGGDADALPDLSADPFVSDLPDLSGRSDDGLGDPLQDDDGPADALDDVDA